MQARKVNYKSTLNGDLCEEDKFLVSHCASSQQRRGLFTILWSAKSIRCREARVELSGCSWFVVNSTVI